MRNKPWLRLLSAASACLAIALAAGGVWSTRLNSPFNEHIIYLAKLQSYRDAASRLQRDVLLVTTGRLLSYDPLVADLNELRERKIGLLTMPSFLSAKQKQSLVNSVDSLDKILSQTDRDLLLFMQQNSILRNSLYFLNQCAKDADCHSPGIPEIYETIAYFHLSDDDAKNKLLAKLNQSSLDNSIVKHIKIILAWKSNLNDAVDRLLSPDLERTADSIFVDYLAFQEQATKPAEFSRLWIYIVFVALLMCLAIYILERLSWSLTLVKAAEAKYREIFENASDGIFQLQKDGVLSANPAAQAILGIDSEMEALAKIREIASLPDNEEASRRIKEALTNRATINGMEVAITVPPSSKQRWLVFNARVREQIVNGSVLDITARKEAELLFEEFYAFVSHELRTPLTSIVGALYLLNSHKLEEDQFTKILHNALSSSERLVRLVNDLLDMKKVQSGKFELFKEDVSFAVVLNSAVGAVSGLKSKKNFEITVSGETETELCLDVDRVTQVLINLLSNAIKFSPENAEILVSVTTVSAEGKKHLRCSVIDSGAGVTEEQEKFLFQRFSQIGKSKGDKLMKGSGLGLFISRSIIEQHDGSVGYTPNPSGGSIFWFDLPIVLADVSTN